MKAEDITGILIKIPDTSSWRINPSTGRLPWILVELKLRDGSIVTFQSPRADINSVELYMDRMARAILISTPLELWENVRKENQSSEVKTIKAKGARPLAIRPLKDNGSGGD